MTTFDPDRSSTSASFSSWPERRRRRRLAEANYGKLLTRFDNIAKRMSLLESYLPPEFFQGDEAIVRHQLAALRRATSKTPGQPEEETSPGLCVADDPLGSSDEGVDPPPRLSLAECSAATLTTDAPLQSDVPPQCAGGMFRHCLAKAHSDASSQYVAATDGCPLGETGNLLQNSSYAALAFQDENVGNVSNYSQSQQLT